MQQGSWWFRDLAWARSFGCCVYLSLLALLLTNGHEEHSGAVTYLLNHLKIPRIMGPRFVSAFVSQSLMHKSYDTIIDTIETRHPYQIGPFEVEWIQVNDAIADACALQINTPEGTVIYTSSFKLDQTPAAMPQGRRYTVSSCVASANDDYIFVFR